jgi:predicted O-methyltransferase YrrM
MQLSQVLFRAGIALKYGLEYAGLRRQRYKKALKTLERTSHPNAAKIAAAINAAYTGNVATADKTWFEKIESLRRRLLIENTEISRLDFGAGHAFDPDAEPTVKKTTVSRLCRVAGTPEKQGQLLYYLVKELKPQCCLELGTCLGISAAYQAAALERNAKIVTLEGDPATAEIARKTFREMGLTNVEVITGPFAETLPETLLSLKQIDFVLIDGHHDGEAMKNYFALIQPWLSENACIVFDDIDWSAGMQKGWKELENQNTSGAAVDLGRVGIILRSNR